MSVARVRTEETRHLAAEAELVAVDASEETAVTGRVWRRGSGAVLSDLDGNDCIDLGAGTMTQSVGHCHPQVVASVRDQAGELENVHDCPSPLRLRAARALSRLLPPHLGSLAFFSTGAEAVEAALRVVRANAEPGRRRIAALRHGFHGKTRGARSLVQWDIGAESASPASLGYAAYCYRCPFGLRYPSCDLLCARLTVRQAIDKPDTAALLAEPVQGAGGVIVPPRGYWPLIAEACTRNGVLLVADEVLTGGGRTGLFLASQAFGLEPDLVTLAKGIGSGYPVSVLAGRPALLTAASWAAAGGFSSTFGGSPVGLAAATATLDLLGSGRVLERVPGLAEVLAEEVAAFWACPNVGDIRQIGLLCAIELVASRDNRTPAPELARRVVGRAAELGVRVLPGGHVIRIAPPFVIEPDLLREAVRRLGQALMQASQGDT